MANSFTTNLNLTKPEVGADSNLWGGHLNGDMDILDSIFTSVTTMLVSTVLKSDTSVADATTPTKRVLFNLTGITAANTRNLSVQDADGTLAYTAQVAAATTGLGTVTTGQVAAATATGVALLAAANTFTASNTIPLTVLSSGVTTTAGDNSTKLATTAYVDRVAPGPSPVEAVLASNAAIASGASYGDILSITLGPGQWFVGAVLTFSNSSSVFTIQAVLWDGTTYIGGGANPTEGTQGGSISLGGFITNPAGNIVKLSALDPRTGSSTALSNLTGSAKDTKIWAFRIT